MNKILVLGGDGMLGHKVFQRLRADFSGTLCTMRESPSIPPLDRVRVLEGPDVVSGIDAMKCDSLVTLLRSVKPEFTVNCIGIVKQRQEAQDSITSITINSLLPHRLAAIAAEWGGRVIHFSTDCVFDGKRGRYTESDTCDANDLYGRSKALGELAVPNALTIRTSIVGRELKRHRSLLDWFLSQNGGTVRGFTRVIYSGLTTNHVAWLVSHIIRSHPELTGLYQAASEPISKHDLLCLIRSAYQMQVDIIPDEIEVSDRSMAGDKLRGSIGYVAPSWPELVRELAEDPTPYSLLSKTTPHESWKANREALKR